MLFLSLAVLVAIVGGRWPAVVAAVAGALLLNYFFIPPAAHPRRRVRAPTSCALLVFALTAVAVVVGRRRGSPPSCAGPGRRARGRDPRDAQPPGPRRGVRRTAAARRWPATRSGRGPPSSSPRSRAGVAASVVVPAGAGGWLVLAGAELGPRERSVRRGVRHPRRGPARARGAGAAEPWPPSSSRPATAPGPRSSPRSRTTCVRRWPDCARRPRPCRPTTTGSTTPSAHELLDAMESSIARLTAMVSDLLDMSRLETGAVRPIADDVPLGEVVRRALAGLDGAERVRRRRAPHGVRRRRAARARRRQPGRERPALQRGGRGRSATPAGARVGLRVVDHGPGVDPADRGADLRAVPAAGRRPAPGSVSAWPWPAG